MWISATDDEQSAFELSDGGKKVIQYSIRLMLDTLRKYEDLLEEDVIFWAAMILHPR
jgi:hypothetical protein